MEARDIVILLFFIVIIIFCVINSIKNRKIRKERDDFVDLILSSVGYKVIRTRSITETTLDCITENEEPAQICN